MNTINFGRAAEAIVSGMAGEADAGENFWQALQNREPDSSWINETRIQKGVAMGCAGSEGLPAIIRAYRHLAEPIAADDFALMVAGALQKFARHFPENEDNICYAHFLLHGLVQSNAEKVVSKIEDNTRILLETRKIQQLFLRTVTPEQTVYGFTLKLRPGHYDDHGGISLWLEPGNGGEFNPFVQIGFFIDSQNCRAIIGTVQGRQVFRGSRNPELQKKSKADGRSYARLSAQLGCDPREVVLQQVLSILEATGIREVLAIRPEEHVMAIGQHPGFRANYQPVLNRVGMIPLNETYYIAKRTQADQVV